LGSWGCRTAATGTGTKLDCCNQGSKVIRPSGCHRHTLAHCIFKDPAIFSQVVLKEITQSSIVHAYQWEFLQGASPVIATFIVYLFTLCPAVRFYKKIYKKQKKMTLLTQY